MNASKFPQERDRQPDINYGDGNEFEFNPSDITLTDLTNWYFKQPLRAEIAALIEEQLKNPNSECARMISYCDDTYIDD